MQLLLWVEIALVWMLAAYGVESDYLCGGEKPPRSWHFRLLVRAGICAAVTCLLAQSVWIALIAFAVIVLQAEGRSHVRYNAPWAELALIAILLGTGLIVWRLQLRPAVMPGLSLPPEHLAAICAVIAIFVFLGRGGAHFVAASLRAIDIKTCPADQPIVGRGYIIGILERLILAAVVAFGSFEALAFLVAAKGLIRAKEFEGAEGREFTEYFIAGTLLSVLLAIFGGLLIRFTLIHLWPELAFTEGKGWRA